MWIITIYSKNGIFTTLMSGGKFKVIVGCKILSEAIYFNDLWLVES
ncbi:hypothetical protein [Peribacillus muralis]